MRYLKTIKLKNFQSYRDETVYFENGLNLLVGTSGSGKSSLLRALSWVYYNEPRGTDFITFGENSCSVTLTFSDDTVITRQRTPTKNCYIVNEVYYDKIGINIPEEVIKSLGTPPLDGQGRPIAYSDQFSPLFLVSLSKNDLSREISHLIGTNNFETAISNLNQEKLDFKKQVASCQVRVSSCKEELTQYEGLDDKLIELDKLEKKQKRIDIFEIVINEMNTVLEKYTEINKEIASLNKNEYADTDCSKARSLYDKLTLAEGMSNKYKNLISQACLLSEDIDIPDISKSKKLFVEINKAKDIIKRDNKIKKDIESLNIESLDKEIIKRDKELQDLILDYKIKGLWCEICQRPRKLTNQIAGSI